MLFSDDGYVAGMKAGRPTQRPRTPFGERIAQARELAGLTQLQLAEKLEVSQEVIAYWERKPVALRAEQLAALADALNVTADSLIGRPTRDRAPKGPPGKLRLAFEKAHKLPRNQQSRIVEFVEAYVDRYASKAS
jgi:transcriptional regulator with XRE-family HTH domain